MAYPVKGKRGQSTFFFQCGTPTDVEAQVLDAIEQLNGLRLMVGAGCTYPVTVPVGNLLTAREAVAKA